MSYPHTDVLCCFPGIGRTTFSSEQNKEGSTFCLDLDYDGEHLKEFVERVKAEREAKGRRYVLISMDADVLQLLREQNIPNVIIAPDPDDFHAWAKKWMRAGAFAETLVSRKKRWGEIRKAFENNPCVVLLTSDEWIGNILEQTRASAEDGRDV